MPKVKSQAPKVESSQPNQFNVVVASSLANNN